MTSCPGDSRRRGFSLTELLTVVAIVALVGGLGAGAYQMAHRRYTLAATASTIQGVLRSARNTSLAARVPSFVVVDPASRRVSGYVFERVGAWGFEEIPGGEESGGFAAGGGLAVNRETNRGGKVVAGRFGQGLEFAAGASYECGRESRFDLRVAIAISAWVSHDLLARVKEGRDDLDLDRERASAGASRSVRSAIRSGSRSRAPAAARSRSRPLEKRSETAAVIVEKEGAYALGMTPSGALEGAIGEYRVRTPDGVVVPGRWVHVGLRFDGREVELSVDGVPRDAFVLSSGGSGEEEGPPARAPVTQTLLTISSPERAFPGRIDEVQLSGCVEPLTYEYGPFEHIVGWKKIIRFDGHGHLDARYHDEEIRLVLVELPDVEARSARTTQVVRFDLTFAEWIASFPDDVSLRQAEEEAKVEATYARERTIAITVDRLGVVK